MTEKQIEKEIKRLRNVLTKIRQLDAAAKVRCENCGHTPCNQSDVIEEILEALPPLAEIVQRQRECVEKVAGVNSYHFCHRPMESIMRKSIKSAEGGTQVTDQDFALACVADIDTLIAASKI